MRDFIQAFLKRTFDIREGEMRKTLLMQANIFLLISTLLIVKPTVNGLFIAKIGVERLPEAFILVALFAAILSTVYSRMLRRYLFRTVFLRSVHFSIATLVIFGLLLRLNVLEGWVLYLFYIWVALFAVLSASQFWVLANLVFNVREAKRLFGFIGAGAIAGGIFGGYLTSLIAPFLGSENLLFVSAGLLCITIPLTIKIWKENIEGSQNIFQQKKKLRVPGGNPIRLILQSRHLTYLASIIGLSVLVAKLVDYQFGAVASEYISDPDELTAFFGFWFSNMNLLSLGVQLFLTRRVVGTLGVGSSLIFLPAGIFFGATLLLIFPALWAAIFLKLADGSLKQSINKASVELLALPIPTEIKSQTKTFIDVFVDSAATGISGLILVFLVGGFDLSPRFISLMVIALIGLWVYLTLRIRREYMHTFKLRISEASEADKSSLPDLSIPSVLGGLKGLLISGSEKQKIYVLQKALDLRDERLFDSIIACLDDPSHQVKALAIRNLYYLKSRNLSNRIEGFIHQSDHQVNIEAFEYLIANAGPDMPEVMLKYLESSDLRVSASAIESLAKETRDNATLKTRFQLEQRIWAMLKIVRHQEDPDLETTILTNLINAIGFARISPLYSVIDDQLSANNSELKVAAIRAAGLTLAVQWIPRLSKIMAEEKYSMEACIALSGYGEAIIPHYRKKMAEKPNLTEIWRRLPSLLEKIPTQRSADFLFELMDFYDAPVRMEALKGLNKLQREHPGLKFRDKEILDRIHQEVAVFRITLSALYAQEQILAEKQKDDPVLKDNQERIHEARSSLITLLERRLDSNLERIFRLLGLKYPPEEMRIVYRNIQSDAPHLRENALEFLDNLLQADLKKVLIPIVEAATLDTVTEEAIRNLKLKIPDDYSCYNLLLKVKDTRIKFAVLYLIEQTEDDRFRPLVKPFTSHENDKLRDFAGKVLQALSSS